MSALNAPLMPTPCSGNEKTPEKIPQYKQHTAVSEMKHQHVALGIPSHGPATEHSGTNLAELLKVVSNPK
jgi:hypothetical protein